MTTVVAPAMVVADNRLNETEEPLDRPGNSTTVYLKTKQSNNFVEPFSNGTLKELYLHLKHDSKYDTQDRVMMPSFSSAQTVELLNVNSRQVKALTSAFGDVLRRTEFELVPCGEGENGTLFLSNVNTDKPFAVFKPIYGGDDDFKSKTIDNDVVYHNSDEDSKEDHDVLFIPTGIEQREAPLREVVAYLIDEDGYYGVPASALARVTHHTFGGPRLGVIQEFAQNDGASWDVGPNLFSVSEVQKIAVLDLRLFNCDRHGGNILVRKVSTSSSNSFRSNQADSNMKLIPIDHAYSLPDHVLSDIWFEWLNWRQSRQPITQEVQRHVSAINIDKTAALLRLLNVRRECIRVMKASTLLLKKGVAAGLTLFDIGSMVVAKRTKKKTNEPSDLEIIFRQAIEMEKKRPLDVASRDNGSAAPSIEDDDHHFLSIFSELVDGEVERKLLQQQQQQQQNTKALNASSSVVVDGQL